MVEAEAIERATDMAAMLSHGGLIRLYRLTRLLLRK